MLQRVLRPGLAALAGLAMALVGSSSAQAEEVNPVKFHLIATSSSMRDAKEEVRALTTIDGGAKEKLLGALDDAISELKVVYKDAFNEDLPYVKPEPGDDKDHHNLRHALREVDEAKKQLRAAKGVTDEHRDAAFAALDKAKEKIKDALDTVGK